MISVGAMRAAAVAGTVAAVMIFTGQLLASSGMPSPHADATAWSQWAAQSEGTIESGVYYVLVPGLLLLLVLTATVAELQPPELLRRLTEWGGLIFVVLTAVASVLSSTTASTLGFFDGFEDPEAMTLFTGISAGFHLSTVAVWAFAVAIAAGGTGLYVSGHLSSRLRWVNAAWAVLTAITGGLGLGLLPALVWMVAAAVILLRISHRATGDEATELSSPHPT